MIYASPLFLAPIGSGRRDFARHLSHTTGRAVFRIRRLNPVTYLVTKSDGNHNPHRFNLALLSTVLSIGLLAILHAPTDTVV